MLRKLVSILLVVLLHSSCEKDDIGNVEANWEDLKGRLAVTIGRNYNEDGITYTYGGRASASFYDSIPISAELDAGTVKVLNIELGRRVQPDWGVDYSVYDTMLYHKGIANNEVRWNVEGSNEVPGFITKTSMGFPKVSRILSDTIFKSQSYTIKCNTLENADSVFFYIQHFDGNAISSDWKACNPYASKLNPTSHTFTSSDLKSLSVENDIISVVIVAYRHTNRIKNGRNYRFINYYQTSRYVWIKE